MCYARNYVAMSGYTNDNKQLLDLSSKSSYC